MILKEQRKALNIPTLNELIVNTKKWINKYYITNINLSEKEYTHFILYKQK
jgi:hypothetical protein